MSSSIIPTTFTYKRGATFASWIWSIWLRAPQKFRGGVYKLLIRYFGKDTTSSPFVYKLPFGIYAKIGRAPDEALAMEFVRTKTTIPVPTVLDHIFGSWRDFHAPKPWLTVMTALPGRPLLNQGEPIRLGKATQQQRIHITHVLTDWLDQLRRIPPPHPQRVCGFTGGSLFSYRIDLAKCVGPFANPTEFHAQYFCDAFSDPNPVMDELTERLIAERPTKHYRICLTHGDILPHNILADENFIPTGLIDWECAAWMPEYWERAASFRSHFCWLYAWREIVLDGYPEYDDDMKLEVLNQKWYDA